MTRNEVLTLISAIAAIAAVCVSLYTAQTAKKTALNGTYFSEMAQAYSGYLKCVSEFVSRRGLPERDALASSLYRLLLFAPIEIADAAQDLYTFLFEWAGSDPHRALSVDERTNDLGNMMREHLEAVCRTGNPQGKMRK